MDRRKELYKELGFICPMQGTYGGRFEKRRRIRRKAPNASAYRRREGDYRIMTTSWQTKVLTLLFGLSVLPFFALVGIVLWPYDPLTINSVTIENAGNTVIAGERVYYAVNVVKRTAKVGTVIRQLINSRVITYSPLDGNIDTGQKIVRNYLETSYGDLPGEYMMRFTVTYTYFGFWDVTVAKNSPPFNMIQDHNEVGEKGEKGERGKEGKQGAPGKNFWGK
jgi:hypothetical protein